MRNYSTKEQKDCCRGGALAPFHEWNGMESWTCVVREYSPNQQLATADALVDVPHSPPQSVPDSAGGSNRVLLHRSVAHRPAAHTSEMQSPALAQRPPAGHLAGQDPPQSRPDSKGGSYMPFRHVSIGWVAGSPPRDSGMLGMMSIALASSPSVTCA